MSILPSDTPRLPKWPFLVGDAVLLGIAILAAARSPQPYSNPVILTIAVCVALASILGIIPFLTDYANKQDEALDERQRGLEALTRTVSDSAEQISVAATSLHELSELTRKQLAQAESMPDQLEAILAKFTGRHTKANEEASELLRQEIKALRGAENRKLDSASEKLQQALDEFKQLESALRDKIHTLEAAPSVLSVPAVSEPVAPAVAPVEPATAAKPVIAAEEPAPPPIEPATPGHEAAADTPAEIVAPPAEQPVEAPKKSPPVKKPKPPAPKPAAPEPTAEVENTAELTLSNDEPAPDFPVKSNQKIAGDGATRLLVTAYIGIGNRLFIRGDGAGLSQEKGVPLQFVSIGKWQWESKEATGQVRVRLYKNDETECVALGELTLEAGHQAEVSASF